MPVKLVFRLPKGDRPSHTVWLPVFANDGNMGALSIIPNGEAFLFDNNAGANVHAYASLDGVSFRVP